MLATCQNKMHPLAAALQDHRRLQATREKRVHGLLPVTLPLGQPDERNGPVHLNSLARGST